MASIACWKNVVGVFNYDGRQAERVLDLGRLPLEAPEVHVYEYWGSTYLGQMPRDAKIPLALEAYEGKLLSIVPAAGDRPVRLPPACNRRPNTCGDTRSSWEKDGRRRRARSWMPSPATWRRSRAAAERWRGGEGSLLMRPRGVGWRPRSGRPPGPTDSLFATTGFGSLHATRRGSAP